MEITDADQLTTTYSLFSEALAVGGPEFGTTEWVALAGDDPRRQAAITRAAFSWFAAEAGVGAPASAERLHQMAADMHVEASHDVAGLYSDPAAWRREQDEYDARQCGQ